MYNYRMHAQCAQPDYVLQNNALVFKRTPTQLYHDGLPLQKINIGKRFMQDLRDALVIVNNIVLQGSRKSHSHKQANSFYISHYGYTATAANAVVSGKPYSRFAFCIAWPAAPLTRLSRQEMTRRRLVRVSTIG